MTQWVVDCNNTAQSAIGINIFLFLPFLTLLSGSSQKSLEPLSYCRNFCYSQGGSGKSCCLSTKITQGKKLKGKEPKRGEDLSDQKLKKVFFLQLHKERMKKKKKKKRGELCPTSNTSSWTYGSHSAAPPGTGCWPGGHRAADIPSPRRPTCAGGSWICSSETETSPNRIHKPLCLRRGDNSSRLQGVFFYFGSAAWSIKDQKQEKTISRRVVFMLIVYIMLSTASFCLLLLQQWSYCWCTITLICLFLRIG